MKLPRAKRLWLLFAWKVKKVLWRRRTRLMHWSRWHVMRNFLWTIAKRRSMRWIKLSLTTMRSWTPLRVSIRRTRKLWTHICFLLRKSMRLRGRKICLKRLANKRRNLQWRLNSWTRKLMRMMPNKKVSNRQARTRCIVMVLLAEQWRVTAVLPMVHKLHANEVKRTANARNCKNWMRVRKLLQTLMAMISANKLPRKPIKNLSSQTMVEVVAVCL